MSPSEIAPPEDERLTEEDELERDTEELRQLVAGAYGRLRRSLRVPGLGIDGLALIAGLLVVGWLAAGVYKVQPDEQGVVLRFGKWVDTTEPGLHYHLPWPIETLLLPRVTGANQFQLGTNDPRSRRMLTGDENIVEADCVVQWRIKDAGKYLFNVNESDAAVKVSAESALREIIGRTPIQDALSDKREVIAQETQRLLQSRLDAQQSGILITQVQLQRVDPPSEVIDAFNDVQRARADQERARNEAESYANDILPRARGEAAGIQQEADAYRSQTLSLATGEAASFLAVYQSYTGAKEVTAWRLYMESVDGMIKKASKVIIDSSGKGATGVVPYLPLTDAGKPAVAASPSTPTSGRKSP